MMEYEDNRAQAIAVDPDGPEVAAGEDVVEELEMNRLLEDVESVNIEVTAIHPEMEVDPNMVFEQLEVLKNAPDRVFQVVNLLSQLHTTFLNNQRQPAPVARPEPEPEPVPIVSVDADADFVTVAVWPGGGGNVLDPIVIDIEGGRPAPTTVPEDRAQARDIYVGLVHDVDLIMDIFPEANAEEVYAYLEARREEPQRVTNVIEELIHRRPMEAAPGEDRKRPGENEAVPELAGQVPAKKQKLAPEGTVGPGAALEKDVVGNTDGGQGSAMGTGVTHTPNDEAEQASSTEVEGDGEEDEATTSRIETQLQVLKETFPDADQEYLLELVKTSGHDENTLQGKVADMLENRTYPKLKDQLERERKKALKYEYSTRVFTPEEVLQWFEDPFKFFGDDSQPVSANYERHAIIQLENEFPKLLITSIRKAFLQSNKHYTGAFHALKEMLLLECKTQKFKRRKARIPNPLPMEPDELFYKELAFTRIEDKVKEYLQTKETERTRRMEEARSSGGLMTCMCCYDDENLLEDMIDCGSGHLFCKECVRRGAEVAIGDGKVGLECMSDKCENKFELPSLQMALKSSTFSNLLKKIQAEEISNAGIPDLVQCPHCSFAAIMPNQEDKVFRCLNPECFKETCRFCKEPNHVPLRCEEVEKSDEVKMRTYIENKMTDALVRECYRCNRRFMKEEGCNKMTCVCGATMCYVCRQPIKDYSHFQKGGCPQMCDTVKLHHTEVLKGAEDAKKEFVEKHPEFKDKQLKHDPTKDLPNEPVADNRSGDEDEDTDTEGEGRYDDEDEDHYGETDVEGEDDDEFDEDEIHFADTEDEEHFEEEEDEDEDHFEDEDGADSEDENRDEFSTDESSDESSHDGIVRPDDHNLYENEPDDANQDRTHSDENDSSSNSFKSSRSSDSTNGCGGPRNDLVELSSGSNDSLEVFHHDFSTDGDVLESSGGCSRGRFESQNDDNVHENNSGDRNQRDETRLEENDSSSNSFKSGRSSNSTNGSGGHRNHFVALLSGSDDSSDVFHHDFSTDGDGLESSGGCSRDGIESPNDDIVHENNSGHWNQRDETRSDENHSSSNSFTSGRFSNSTNGSGGHRNHFVALLSGSDDSSEVFHHDFSTDEDVLESSGGCSRDGIESPNDSNIHENNSGDWNQRDETRSDENDSFKSSGFLGSMSGDEGPKNDFAESSSGSGDSSVMGHRSSSSSVDFATCNGDSPTTERSNDNSSGFCNSSPSEEDSESCRSRSQSMYVNGSPVMSSTTSNNSFASSPQAPPDVISTEEDYLSGSSTDSS